MRRTNTHNQEWVRYHVDHYMQSMQRLERERQYAVEDGRNVAVWEDALVVADRKLKYWKSRLQEDVHA